MPILALRDTEDLKKYSKVPDQWLCPIDDNYYYKLFPSKSPEARVKDKANYNPLLASKQTPLEGLKKFTFNFNIYLQ